MHNSYRVGFLDLYRSGDAGAADSGRGVGGALARAVFLVLVVDVAVAFSALVAFHNWSFDVLKPSQAFAFDTNVIDCLLLALLRVFVVPVFALLGVWMAQIADSGSSASSPAASRPSALGDPLLGGAVDGVEEQKEKEGAEAGPSKGQRANALATDQAYQQGA